MQEWEEECMKYHGRVLEGDKAHWCPEWDYLPIDSSCEMEMESCSCDLDLEKSK